MHIQTVLDYKNLVSKLADLIEISGYRHDYIARKLGMKPQNFSVKKQRVTWNPDEVEKLLTIIDNDDVENYLMLEHLRSLKAEETMSLDELKKFIEWK